MNAWENLSRFFAVPVLTRRRIWLAMVMAAAVDAMQLALGPLGWFLVDEVLDVVAMILTCATLGFHPLLLPTFVLEFIPLADLLPTWTGCVGAVILLRKRSASPAPPPLSVEATVTPVQPPMLPPPEGKD